MTPKQASDIIGCSPQQVRTLIRNGTIQAIKVKIPGGYYWNVSLREARRYRDAPISGGFPRGQKRK